jgi:hypothetical protein
MVRLLQLLPPSASCAHGLFLQAAQHLHPAAPAVACTRLRFHCWIMQELLLLLQGWLLLLLLRSPPFA